jgi:hypothetical protein
LELVSRDRDLALGNDDAGELDLVSRDRDLALGNDGVGYVVGAVDAGKLVGVGYVVGAVDAGKLVGAVDAGKSRHMDAAGAVDAGELGLDPFDVFVTSPQLQDEIGIGLIDTGAQVSLVKSRSLKKSSFKAKCKEIHVNVQGINGDSMHIDKGIMLQVNDSKEMLFYVVESLPRNLDLIMGQEWLMENDYVMTCPKIILPVSESVVKMPTRERGIRFV